VEMPFSQEQPVVARMLDEPSAGLHEALLRATSYRCALGRPAADTDSRGWRPGCGRMLKFSISADF
jgi:hypothetical protein